jgi:hypothetical protein
VNELRLSLIWMKASVRDTFLPFLADGARYTVEFEAARTGKGWWSLPWQAAEPQHFWQYYLSSPAPADFKDIAAGAARQYFVPLRAPNSFTTATKDGLEATLEAFCFPHSVGVVATVRLRPDPGLSLPEMVKAAVQARHADYSLTASHGVPSTHGALDSLADKILNWLHPRVLDGKTYIGKPLSSPLTIATIIDATGVWGKSSDDPPLRHILEALCALPAGWADGPAPSDPAPMSPQATYAHTVDRGRAVWMAPHYGEIAHRRRRRASGCYHRNLTLASLQTRGLTSLIRRAEEILAAKGNLLTVQQSDVAQAIDILTKLYHGDGATYQSLPLKDQIQFDWEKINKIGVAIGV